MASYAPNPSRAPGDLDELTGELQRARRATLELVAALDDEQLEQQFSPIMSPLVWDLGHIAAYEDLWLAHRLGGLPLVRPELAERYDAFETPRAIRGEIETLDPPQARSYLEQVRARSLARIAERGAADGVIAELVIRHELQHGETMRQTLAIAGLLSPAERELIDRPLGESDGEWLEIPAGTFAMGAPDGGFAYDNERPRHEVGTPPFQIASQPVSNASWMQFSESGGYEQREWWSPEGWAWRAQQSQTHHPSIATGNPRAPACHLSFYEAEAFAAAHGARLPSEAEWERAATLLPASGAGADGSGSGALGGVGRVWEWTSSSFEGYPGFRAHPYREYSEVFFGGGYRVLRGGSWATDKRVAGPHFRNWDLPQRRQIFAGLRLARDARPTAEGKRAA